MRTGPEVTITCPDNRKPTEEELEDLRTFILGSEYEDDQPTQTEKAREGLLEMGVIIPPTRILKP